MNETDLSKISVIDNLIALALVPPEMTTKAFNHIKAQIPTEWHEMLAFLEKFENQWIVTPNCFSAYQSLQMFTDVIAKYQAMLSNKVPPKMKMKSFFGNYHIAKLIYNQYHVI